jgi:hypothetical protein
MVFLSAVSSTKMAKAGDRERNSDTILCKPALQALSMIEFPMATDSLTMAIVTRPRESLNCKLFRWGKLAAWRYPRFFVKRDTDTLFGSPSRGF